MIEKYITIRESYSYNDLDFQKKFLFNNSTSFLYLEYEENINVSNPTSPLLIYGKDESLVTDVKSIQIINDDSGLPTKAEVVFDVYKRSPGKNKVLLKSYNANIEFYMSDIYAIKKQNTQNSQEE